MKILLLTPQLPYPPQQGTSLRNYHIVRGLAAQHDVWLLSFLADNQTADPQAIAPLLALCRHVKTVPAPARSSWRRLWQLVAAPLPDMAHRLHSPIFDIGLRRLLSAERFDVVQVEGIELARSMATVRFASPGSRLVFDNHNVETALQQRAFQADRSQPRRWPAAAYSWVQARRLHNFEAGPAPRPIGSRS
jgi:polysaccharide biosynthesis protein PslH